MAKVILCTGIDGEAKRKRLQEIINEVSKFHPGAKVYLYSVGDIMSEVAGAPKESLLDEPNEYILKEYRKEACKRILKAIRYEEKHVGSEIVALVETRAYYYHRSVPKRSLDDSHECLKPAFCVNIIDDIQDMTSSMNTNKRWRTMGLEDFLRWRDFEMMGTEEWANNIRIETLILPAKEPSITLLDLVLSNKKKIYLSFPITHASKEMKNKKEEFVRKLREQFVVFDPISIKEYDRVKKEHEKSKKLEGRTSFDKLKKELGNQTVARDFRLIKQSNAIVVYYTASEVYVEHPEGEAVVLSGQRMNIKKDEGIFLSAGVINEMVYATNTRKKIYAIWTSEKDPSPFFSYHCEHGRLFKGLKAEEEFWEATPMSFIK